MRERFIAYAEEIYQCAQVARRNKDYAYIMRLAGFFLTENQAPECMENPPLQISENERPRKAKTTFETFWNISNVISLMSYVGIRACGRFFRSVGNAFPDKKEKRTRMR